MFHGHHRIEVHLSEYQQPVEAEQGLNLEALILLRILTLHWQSALQQYEMAEGEKQEAGINTLPRDMKEALEIFKQSTYMKELLGEHIFNKYVEAKSAEWESYQKFVSQWEVDRYLYKI